MFLGVICAISVLQVFILFCGTIVGPGVANAFSVHVLGLTQTQWMMCVCGGLITIPINFALKFVPDTLCPLLGDEPDEDKLIATKDYEELIAIAEKYKAF